MDRKEQFDMVQFISMKIIVFKQTPNQIGPSKTSKTNLCWNNMMFAYLIRKTLKFLQLCFL